MHLLHETRSTRHEAEPKQQQVAPLPHIVIVGAGCGGGHAARALGKVPVQLTVIDRTTHHLFAPLLSQAEHFSQVLTHLALSSTSCAWIKRKRKPSKE